MTSQPLWKPSVKEKKINHKCHQHLTIWPTRKKNAYLTLQKGRLRHAWQINRENFIRSHSLVCQSFPTQQRCRRNTPTEHVRQTAHHNITWILSWIAPSAHLIGHPFPHDSSLVLAPTWGFVPSTPTLLALVEGCDYQTKILAWLKQPISEVIPSSLLVTGHNHSETSCHWSSRGIYFSSRLTGNDIQET